MVLQSSTFLSRHPRLHRTGLPRAVHGGLAKLRFWVYGAGLFLTLCVGVRPSPGQTDQSGEYSRGETLIRNHRWDEGIQILEPLLAGDISNLRILNLLGLAYTGKGDLQHADQYFEAALKIRPTFAPALKNLAINEAALGQILPARGHLQAALKEVPDDPVVNLYLGEFSYRQQDFEHAEQYLLHAGGLVTRNPDLLASLAVSELKVHKDQASLETFSTLTPGGLNAESQSAVGVALAESGFTVQAIPYLEAARAAQPSLSNFAYDLAICYMAVYRLPDAIELLDDLSDKGHESSETDTLLAEAYDAQHETQKAVDVLRRAIARDPADDNNYLAFASLCMDHQAFEDANKVLAVGLSVHPKSGRLLFERGILDAMQNHYDLAERDFQASADSAPTDSAAYIGLGVTFLETGNATRAIPLLRGRLKDHPNDANLSYLLGEALLKTGAQEGSPSLAEAQALLERSVRLNPRLVEPHIALGTIYLRHDKLQDAVDQLELARHLDPKAKSAYSHLAIAYRKLGQQEKSKDVLVELKRINDLERTGSRQLMQSPEPGPEGTAVDPSHKPGSN